MRGDEVLPEVPLVLDHLRAEGAGDALRLDVHVDDVLLQVERVGERFPAIVAEAGLHAPPPVSRVLVLLVVVVVAARIGLVVVVIIVIVVVVVVGVCEGQALSFRAQIFVQSSLIF